MANTLKFGNGTWATKKGSTLAYNDENDRFKPLPFTTTRASGATRVNKEGLIEVVENDRPRIDYTDSADGALLLEPSATNLVTYSEDFSNAYWSKSGSSVVSGFLSPKGDLSAFKLVEDNANGNHRVDTQGISITNGVSQTFSMFLKYDNSVEWIRVREFGINAFAYFNIKDNTTGATNLVNNSEKIEDFGNGWKRVSFTYNSTTSGANFRIYLADGDNIDGYQGDGTSGVYIYGAQLEEGYATSYIPTSGSAVTRSADVCNNGGNEQVINSTEGVLYAEISGFENPTSQEVALSVSEGQSGVNRLLIRMKTNGRIGIVLRVANTTEASIDSGVLDQSVNHKVAVKWKVNDIALWIDGVEVGTESSANVFSANTLDEVSFNQGNGSNQFYGNTKDVRLYNTALTDLELQQLTTI